jgi:hypothetical protein
MYADSNIVHESATDCPEGFQAFRSCLKRHLLYLDVSCCGTVHSRSFWVVPKKVRIQWRAIEIGD